MFYGVYKLKLQDKPVIVVSRCLGFGVCRWDGAVIESHLVRELKNEVNFLPVCPECEIGLGVPRQPIRLVQKDSRLSLVQPATGIDLTDKITIFAEKFLQSLDRVDGFLLKRKSPSCGLAHIPIYVTSTAEYPLNKNGSGFFAQAVHKFFPESPKLDEECPGKAAFLKQLQ